MASYNADFNRMQEEAMQRLREMQSRSRTAVNRPRESPPPQQGQRQSSQHGSQQSNWQNRQEPRPNLQQNFQQSSQQTKDPLKALLSDMKIDSEKAMILLILFILYKNKSDPKLLLALGYLLI